MTSKTIRADGGLSVRLARDGVAAASLGGKRLALSGPGGFSVEEVLQPAGRVRALGRAVGRVSSAGGALRFAGGVPGAALELSATFRGGAFLDVRGEVRDLSGAERALRVSFALPAKLAGWRWEGTAGCSRTIRPGAVCPSKRDEFLYLGQKGDGFANEAGQPLGIRINKLPYTTVAQGNLALAMACPVHEPRVFLITASERALAITFSLGVTPVTRKFPGRASFRFVIFPADAEWGIRSACERYQGFFPELFRGRCRRHGNNGTVYNPEKRPPSEHMADMGYATLDNDFQWSGWQVPAASLKLAAGLGLGPRDIYHWRGPWYSFHEAPGDISRDAQLALMKAQAEGRAKGAHGKNNQLCGCPDGLSARAAYNSFIEDEEGKLNRVYFAYPSYSCWLLPMNLDPNLPVPNRGTLATEWQFRNVLLAGKQKGFRGPFNCAYDAFDDFSGFRRLNFRREHLAVMDTPATFDPASGRICQVKGFHDWAWARYHTGLVHDAGGKVLSNVNLEGSMMYGGQFIDFIERERRPRDYSEERLSTHRMLLAGKPIAFCGGGWSPKTRRGWLAAARKLLLFGMSPGPLEERWRELRAHMPLLRRVAEAGWQPVPPARGAGLWIERFGTEPGRLYLTVRNTGKKPARTRLAIDLEGLGLDSGTGRLVVRQISPEAPVRFARRGKQLVGRVRVAAKETVVLAVGAGS
jgi:hypothetical protein